MSVLELLIVLLSGTALLVLARRVHVTILFRLIAALVVCTVIGSIAGDGYNWQLLPTYVAALIIGGISLFRNSWQPQQHKLGTITVCAVLLIGTVAACFVLPIRRLAPPSGPYLIGVADLPSNVLQNTPRQLQNGDLAPAPLVRIWYPTAGITNSGANKYTWWIRLWRFATSPYVSPGLPNAPVADSARPFPVLTYFSGWPGTAVDNLILIRNLVSHGFVVATVQYPAQLPNLSDSITAKQTAWLAVPMDYSSEAAYKRTSQVAEERVRSNAHDAIAVLDAMGRLNSEAPPSRFTGRLEVNRCGIFGFSFGGAVAAEASTLDQRYRAVVNMDGRHWGDSLHSGVDSPYLYIGEPLIMPTDEDLNSTDPDRRFNAALDKVDYSELASNLARHGGTHITIFGAAHANFSDHAYVSPIRRLSYGGAIGATRAGLIVSSYVVAFFEHFLKGQPAPILREQPSRYPHVRIEWWEPPN
jgi:dienelactone hydrolase